MNEECRYACSVSESGDLVSRLKNPSTTTIVPAIAAYPRSKILVKRRATRKDSTPTPATANRIHASLPVGRVTMACESVAMPRLNEAKRGANPLGAGNASCRLSRVWNIRSDSRLLIVPKRRKEGVGRAANLDAAWLWCKNKRTGEEYILFRNMICEKDIRVFGEDGDNQWLWQSSSNSAR